MPRRAIETGLSIYYESAGEGDAVVLVQGLDRDHNGMMSQAKELSKSFKVLTYDARGTGQSDTPPGPYTCGQMAEDVCALLRALRIERAHLIGASLGGQIVQEFAINYPGMTDSIILLCTFAKPDHYLQSMGRFWISAIEKIGHAQLCEEIMHWSYSRLFFEANRQRLDTVRLKLKELEAGYNVQGFQWKAEAGINADTSGRLHMIKAPTLVLAGELDSFVPPALCEDQLVRHIDGSRFEVVKGAAHAFFDEKPDEVNSIILSFLSNL